MDFGRRAFVASCATVFAGCGSRTSVRTPSTGGRDRIDASGTWSMSNRSGTNVRAVEGRTDTGDGVTRHWTTDFAHGRSRSVTAVTFGEDLAVVGVEGRLNVFDRATGDRRNVVELSSPLSGEPALIGIDAVVPVSEGLVRVSLETGERVWETDLSGTPTGPTVSEGCIAVGASEGDPRLYLLDAESGEIVWERDTGLVSSSPAIADERVVFGDDRGIVSAVSFDGTRTWTTDAEGDWIRASPVVRDGRVFVCSGVPDVEKGYIQSFDPESKSVKWSAEITGSSIVSTPAVSSDALAVVDTGGTLSIYGRADGERRATLDAESGPQLDQLTAPSMAGKRVYFTSNGRLRAVELREDELEVVWQTRSDETVVTPPSVTSEYVFYATETEVSVLG